MATGTRGRKSDYELGIIKPESLFGTELSPREQQVLNLAFHYGLTYKAIGIKLGTSEQTVKNQVATILKRLGAKSLTHAIYLLLVRTGILSQGDTATHKGDTK